MYVAFGDIKKMYNYDWLEEYEVPRGSMGAYIASTLFTHLKEQQEVIHRDNYVDDLITSHHDLNKLSLSVSTKTHEM